jgi:hypothetical protein
LVVVVGVMFLLRDAGIWFSDRVAPVGAVVAVGAVLVWGAPKAPTPCFAIVVWQRGSLSAGRLL